MEAYVSWEDDPRPILYDHAQVVEAMQAALPWHERKVIIPEHLQKNAKFGGMDPKGRRKGARAWIAKTTSVTLNDTEHKLYLGLFHSQVERRLA